MGDTACMVHGFSYASAIPNESKQGNPMHALGESISFGRFMTESLSWEKWSTFSHKKYVEEAERYAQPGSVAQKKAFFEAHYKKIAAQKAAALLEQENASKVVVEEDVVDNKHDGDQRVLLNNSHFEKKESKIQDENEDDNENGIIGVEEICKEGGNDVIIENDVFKESPVKINSTYQLDNLENPERVSVSEGTGSPQMERPLLKNSKANEEVSSVTSKKRSNISSLKSSIQRKTWRIPATPAKPPAASHFNKENYVTEITSDSTDKNRSSPKSLRALINLIPIKAPDKEPISAAARRTTDSLGSIARRVPKDCLTPLRTPKMAASKGAAKYPSATPLSENRRIKTPVNPTAGSKTAGPKWHILSAVSKSLTACKKKLQSPTSSSTPFILRTEERAAKRKQRLEEKFNVNEIQKVPQPQKTLKEKAGNEFRKLSHSFCFKARPLPNFYKERETSKNQTKMNPAAKSQQAVLKRNNSNKKQGIGGVLMPVPLLPPSSFKKNNGTSKNTSRKNVPNLGKLLKHENTSPNFQ